MYVGDGTVIRSREVKPSYRARPQLRDPAVRKEVAAAARTVPAADRPLVGASGPPAGRPGPGWPAAGSDAAEALSAPAAQSEPPALPRPAAPAQSAVVPVRKSSTSGRKERAGTRTAADKALLARIADLEWQVGALAERLQEIEAPDSPHAGQSKQPVAQAYVYTGGQAEVSVGPVTVNNTARIARDS